MRRIWEDRWVVVKEIVVFWIRNFIFYVETNFFSYWVMRLKQDRDIWFVWIYWLIIVRWVWGDHDFIMWLLRVFYFIFLRIIDRCFWRGRYRMSRVDSSIMFWCRCRIVWRLIASIVDFYDIWWQNLWNRDV